ncbi:MAG: glycosyltransferase family 4 protein [Theionarchaea archaeon]|nr:glycosyltransferase family 4 protein [Theionarchaea archaeon]
MACIAVIATRYPDDVRVYKEVRILKKTHDVHIFLTDTRKTSPLKEIHEGVTLYRFPYRKSYSFLKYCASLYRYLKITKSALQVSPSVCHVHNFPLLPAGIITKMCTRCKLVYDAHEDYASMRYRRNRIKIFIMRKIEIALTRLFADCIITVNESLARYFYHSRVETVIVMNVPLLDIGKKSGSVDLPLLQGDYVIGLIGNIIWSKGFETLIPLCEELKKAGNNPTFLIVGGGPFRDQFQQIIKEHTMESNFVLTGHVPHEKIPLYLEKIDIGLALQRPTHYNNIIATPTKLFEYMAHGIPVIASDLPEIRKIIQQTGCGILVNPERVKEITEAIFYLLNNPKIASKMGKKGKKAFKTQYNWEIENQVLVRTYIRLLQ